MSATIKAVRTLPVYDARGRIVPMNAGPCLSCRRIDAAFHTLTGGY